MWKRDTAFDGDKFLQEEWSGVDAPVAELAADRMSLARRCP
jgi:hypothetical protein